MNLTPRMITYQIEILECTANIYVITGFRVVEFTRERLYKLEIKLVELSKIELDLDLLKFVIVFINNF